MYDVIVQTIDHQRSLVWVRAAEDLSVSEAESIATLYRKTFRYESVQIVEEGEWE